MNRVDPAPTPFAEHHQLHGLQPVLPVSNVLAAATWFRDMLGFEIEFLIDEPPSYGRVKCGSLEAGGWGAPVYIHLRTTAEAIKPFGELRLHVGHDLDGLFAACQARGASVLQAPVNQAWGLRECILATPDGYALVLGAEAPPEADAP